MPRPRKPYELAVLDGSAYTRRSRYEGRQGPTVDEPLGGPSSWLPEDEHCRAKSAWRELADMVPWANRSHRGIFEITATLFGRVIAGRDIGVQALNLLRQCLGQLGATPADSRKITMPAPPTDDPADRYFT